MRTILVGLIAAAVLLPGGRLALAPREALADIVGDANCDGSVNSIDATLVLQLSAGLVQSTACQGKADANGDGSVDSRDAALVLQFTAGLLAHLGPDGAPTPTPAVTAFDYDGTHAAGGTVTFRVRADNSEVIQFNMQGDTPFCSFSAYNTPVTGSYFSLDHGDFSFNGVLETADSASGTLSYDRCDLANVPWTASRQ
ncbi:MAG: dockerin type I repeat-containing protein [bacterium]